MTELILAYFNFWSTAIPFGDGFLNFYNEQLVPTNTPFPYGTFTVNRNDMFINGIDPIRIWTRSTNLLQLATLLDGVDKAIPNSGVMLTLPENKGAVRLFRGTPWQQRQPLPDGEQDIQVGYVNVETRSFIY